MTIRQEYNREIARIHRSFGQFKKYLQPDMTFEKFTGYEAPSRITRGSIRRLREVERKARAELEYGARIAQGKTEEVKIGRKLKDSDIWKKPKSIDAVFPPVTPPGGPEPEDYQIAVDNFLYLVDSGYYHVLGWADWKSTGYWSTIATQAANRLNDALHGMIDRAIQINGIERVGKGLMDFIARHGKEIEHYAYAVIDTSGGGFNTNRKWNRSDAGGSVGREKFISFTRELCEAVGLAGYADIILTEAGIK